MDTADAIVRDAAMLGVRLYLRGAELRATPSGTATPELRARIADHRPQVVDHLRAVDLFAAWDAAIGYAPLSADGLIQYAARHPSLMKALEAVAGSPPDLRQLEAHLALLAGVTVHDHQIIAVGSNDSSVPNDGLVRWRLASTWSIAMSGKQAKTQEMFKTTEDWS